MYVTGRIELEEFEYAIDKLLRLPGSNPYRGTGLDFAPYPPPIPLPEPSDVPCVYVTKGLIPWPKRRRRKVAR